MFKGERRGVRVLYSQNSSYTLHTASGTSMEELYPQESFFAALLPALGVPYAYCDTVGLTGQIVAASGQVLRNWGEAELERLFQNNFVILNADALWTLCDMGLGRLAGVESARWLRQNSGAYAYEQVTNGRRYCGRENARASAVISCADALDVTYLPGEEVCEYTALFDSFRRRAACGQAVVGGRVLVYPFGNFGSPTAMPPMLLNAMRAAVLHDVLRAARAPFPLVPDAPYLEPYCFERDGALSVYLVNGSADSVPAVRLAMPQTHAGMRAEVWRSDRDASESVSCRREGDMLTLCTQLGAMETLLARFFKE